MSALHPGVEQEQRAHRRWYFWLREDSGRKVSKRYTAEDLRARCP
ncbi:hypothetical protein [Kitasatospora sp. MAP5-34]|nr:hypothetical protein [Kitasatospora sp. MAP5-34]MDH6577416.1 hypothetical protein [Kitasatospora sp. MAP5-34]